jgi:ribosome-binding factor A
VSNDGRRTQRVAELIKTHVVDLLRDLDDQRLSLLVITDVRLSDDLSIATLSVRSLQDVDDERARRSLMRALRHAERRVRRGLAGRIEMKRLPELRFHYDVGQDHARRVEELLREIEDEKGPEEPDR